MTYYGCLWIDGERFAPIQMTEFSAAQVKAMAQQKITDGLCISCEYDIEDDLHTHCGFSALVYVNGTLQLYRYVFFVSSKHAAFRMFKFFCQVRKEN